MVVGKFAKLRGSVCAENVWKFDSVYLPFVILQLRPERASQCTVSLPPFKCDCDSGHGGSKGVLVRSSSLEKFGKRSSCRRGRDRLDKNFGSLDRKPIVEVQARVQDTVEHETYDRESGFEHKFHRKDPTRRQKNSGGKCERRRRVQVVTNNGFVDLEEQLGIAKKDSKEGSLRLKLSSRRNGNKVQKDEEGRLYFEYEFNGADVDDAPNLDSSSFYSAEELQSRQEGDAVAQAASLLDIGGLLASDRGACMVLMKAKQDGNLQVHISSTLICTLIQSHQPATLNQCYQKKHT